MAVHVPLSAEAQAEARFLMLAAGNLLKPSDGQPVTVPTQDMILGSYYLTLDKDGERGEGKVFRDVDEVMMAYQTGVITASLKDKGSPNDQRDRRTGSNESGTSRHHSRKESYSTILFLRISDL
jgi:DNA-directed RNA polymerase beta' subunit